MANCKNDFLREIEGREVKCAEIIYGSYYRDEADSSVARLPESFSDSDYTSFLSKIDYEYDAGYGSQEVFGYIWYTDGTWSERGEYDGSEWWEHKSCPEIPKELKSSYVRATDSRVPATRLRGQSAKGRKRMKKKTEFLRLCPFCGTHEVEICRTNENACWVRCAECGGESTSHPSREGAIKNWNSRFFDDEPAEIVDDVDDVDKSS